MSNLNKKNKGTILSIISFAVNLGLAVTKLLISSYTRSIMILGDSYNNFGDAISNLGHVYSFRKSSAKPTKRHPFGYGKIEHIFTILTAFLVVLIGIFFIRDASERFFIPIAITYRQRWFYILLFTAFVKLSLSIYYSIANNKLNSPVIKAMTYDALQDFFISLLTAFSYKWSQYSSFPLDAILAMILASYMIIQSFILIGDMIKHIIGDNSNSLIQYTYKQMICYTAFKYFNDIKIHNYSKDIIYLTGTIYIEENANRQLIKENIQELIRILKIEKHITAYFNIVVDTSTIKKTSIQNLQQLLILNDLFYDVKIENNVAIIEAELKDLDKKKDPEELLNENNVDINYEVKYYK